MEFGPFNRDGNIIECTHRVVQSVWRLRQFFGNDHQGQDFAQFLQEIIFHRNWWEEIWDSFKPEAFVHHGQKIFDDNVGMLR